MISISLDQQNDRGIFFMCVLASNRARVLSNGAVSFVSVHKKEKFTTIALRELLEDKLFDENPVEASEVAQDNN